MFARIAHRYDLMNRLMTVGQDVRWRREVIQRARIAPGSAVLDLGAGTGDLGMEAARQQEVTQIIAADFTLEMMLAGQARPDAQSIHWAGADALKLPFPSNTFDAVVSGFLLRNVSDIRASLREQHRVLKPGGRLVCLDTTRPPKNMLSPLIDFHLHRVIPALGGFVSGDPDAYRYLPDSTEAFLSAEQLAARLLSVGFRQVGFRRTMLETVAIHWGTK
jgi:demethylmenaquinone methyltransferase/2-methoxy-6-polyprenyl-1,4-benzoquinol methylase